MILKKDKHKIMTNFKTEIERLEKRKKELKFKKFIRYIWIDNESRLNQTLKLKQIVEEKIDEIPQFKCGWSESFCDHISKDELKKELFGEKNDK